MKQYTDILDQQILLTYQNSPSSSLTQLDAKEAYWFVQQQRFFSAQLSSMCGSSSITKELRMLIPWCFFSYTLFLPAAFYLKSFTIGNYCWSTLWLVMSFGWRIRPSTSSILIQYISFPGRLIENVAFNRNIIGINVSISKTEVLPH